MGNQTSSDANIKFGYWGVRYRGQIPRLLLAYSGLNWTDCKYMSPQQYQKDVKQLGFPFPNLPYLVDGDLRLTESRAIAIYIITRSGKTELLGKTPKDGAIVEQLIGVMTDVKDPLAALVIDKDWKSKVGDVASKVLPKLDQLQKFFEDRCYGVGYLTWADFVISEYSYYVENVIPQHFTKYPFLKKVRDAVEGLPEIKKYYASQTALKGPFAPPNMAVIKF